MLRLFGPVELETPGAPVDLGPAQRRAVLAALAVDVGTVVAPGVLLDRVWPGTAPPGARSALYAHLSRLRATLADAGAGALEHRSGGYLLAADPRTIDVHEYVRLCDAVRRPDLGDDDRIERAERALGLWRGVPLAGLEGPWADAVRDRLRVRRGEVTLEWARAQLRRGHADRTIAALEALVDDDPLAEHVMATLIEALHAAGRRAQALDRYAAMRSRLADELGIDPGRQLRAAYEGVLGADATPPPAVLAQLPLEAPGFVGRREELSALDALTADLGAGRVVVAVLSGPAGVGKTSLAVHWAHRMATRFDGQLYVNLHGFDRSGAGADPADAVRGFLDALGVPTERIPPGVDARAALLRSSIAGRRLLVVLDNARDADQVRPLLPGTPGCLVVVTSRNRLAGLVAREGAHPVAIRPLERAEARDLLSVRLGADRTRAEAAAVEQIIDRCASLPLALAVVAARAVGNPAFPLAGIAAELSDAQRRLDALAGDDREADPRTVFSWSYQQLSPDAALLFRLLPVHPGGELDAADAAALIGRDIDRVRPLLAELTRISLLDEPRTGWYSLHDLLRVYARELSADVDAAHVRDGASGRLLDRYARVAHAGALVLNPERPPAPLPESARGPVTESFRDHAEVNAWFDARRGVLVALTGRAVELGRDEHAVVLGWALTPFLDRQGHWPDLLAVQRRTVTAAQRTRNLHAEVTARRTLGIAHVLVGDMNAARVALQEGLDAATRLGDETELGQTRYGLGWVHTRQNEHAAAIEEYERALTHFRAAAAGSGIARTLNAIGWSLIHTGRPEQALLVCAEALELNRGRGEVYGMCETWDSLGYAHHVLGDYAQALHCYEESLALAREIGERYHEAETLVHIGDTRRDSGVVGAREAWTDALRILDELEHPDAPGVRARLVDV